MTTRFLASISIAALLATSATVAFAAPTLKADVVVNSAIVTVGDMFDDAGSIAEEAMFRAPAAGSAGLVSLEAIQAAATRIGLVDYTAEGISQVRVSRAGTQIDEPLLTTLISTDLTNRGILNSGMTAQATFDTHLESLTADAVANPAQLLDMRYTPTNGLFSARFSIAGKDAPLTVTGKIDLMVEVPHLANNLSSGSILQASDIEMRKVTVQMAESNGFASADQLVGKQLQRQSRQGMMLRPADVIEPQLIARNETVTVYFRAGAMTLTVKGMALNSASKGQDVGVLNQTTKKVVHGTALAQGAVEITNAQLNVAGL
jgi:flagella basal body P-ring formation protein FlgA